MSRAPTTRVTWTVDPALTPRTKAQRRLCNPCFLGTHQCTGVRCYGCTDSAHDRRPGVSGLSDGLPGGTA